MLVELDRHFTAGYWTFMEGDFITCKSSMDMFLRIPYRLFPVVDYFITEGVFRNRDKERQARNESISAPS